MEAASHVYRDPPAAFNSLVTLNQTSPHSVAITADNGLTIEVEFLQEIGWQVEVRFDLASKGKSWRQPFTGAQQRIKRDKLTCIEEGGALIIKCGSEELRFRKDSGQFEASIDGASYFRSVSKPFAKFADAVEIFEGVVSRKVTDHSFRSPQFDSTPTYLTEMVRICFEKPNGLILGLPGQTGELNRNGYRFELYNTDTFTHTPNRPPMYQSWPILFSQYDKALPWFGVFFDNPSRTFVDLGELFDDCAVFEAISNNCRFYIWGGSSLELVAKKCSRLVGPIPELPNWAFGYQQCRWSYMSTTEARQVVERLHAEGFGCDAIYFDIDYMDGFRVFTTDQKNFADLSQTTRALRSNHQVNSVAIVDPGVKIDPSYEAYNRIISAGRVLTDGNGEVARMRCWAQDSVLPDFFDSATRQLWSKILAEWVEETGLDGVWNDMNEPSNFDGQNRSNSKMWCVEGPLSRCHNLYGYMMSLASADGLKSALQGKPGVVITRAGYPGVQQHAVIWHGDNCAWWEHLRLALNTTIQYALAGAFYTGPDLPGFTGNPTDDLAVRFYQLGAFLPLFRGHSRYFERDKEPYAYSDQAKAIIREFIKIRYSLVGEWIKAFELARSDYVAPVKPVFSSSGELVGDQFELFGKLLIAPILERGQLRRAVYLPSGEWYRYSDRAGSNRLKGDQWLLEEVTLEQIPIYRRADTKLELREPKLTVC